MTTLRLAASPEMLALARDFIRQQMLVAGMDGRTDDAVLAVNEPVTNAIRHAYPGSSGEVEIVVEAMPDEVIVIVRDRGRGPGRWQDTAGAGFGTTIMAAAAETLDISGRPGTGTAMRFGFRR